MAIQSERVAVTLLSKIKDRTALVGVLGLGYVGLPVPVEEGRGSMGRGGGGERMVGLGGGSVGRVGAGVGGAEGVRGGGVG